jgi:hypothetical protein
VVGLSAALAVQAAANVRLSESLVRETRAKDDLAAANGELTRSLVPGLCEYNLGLQAIQTLHTGVSEDFLLRQDQSKELRDRLLKSASKFYD